MIILKFIKSLLGVNKTEDTSKKYISFSDQKFSFCKKFATIEVIVNNK